MSKKEELDKLYVAAKNDNSLPLKEGATNLVFGVGAPEAKILFIGEGPGYWEDIKAEPFVGNAGALLNQMLRLIGIEREEVYITNVVMYRPPNNRDPLPSEIEAFGVYLDGIIDIIQPLIICTLGRFSMAKFLPGVFISDVHGHPKEIGWKGRKLTIVPMYHPAAALRSGEVKIKFKNDFAKIPEIIKKVEDESHKDDIMNKDIKEQLSLV